jgi:hypothetical protein
MMSIVATRRAGVLAWLALLAGCSTTPVVVRDSFVASQASAHGRRPAAQPLCRIHVNAISDSRSDPGILGTIAGRTVVSPGQGATWIANRMASELAAQGVAVSFAPDAPPDGALSIDAARLVTAWVAPLATSMNSSVVFSLRARADSSEQFYRGNDTTVNWAAGEGEINRLMDRSFAEMFARVGADLRTLCSDGKR